MTQREKSTLHKFHSVLLSYMLRSELEELSRLGFRNNRQKLRLNTVISQLSWEEHLFHKLDEVIPQEATDTVMASIHEYMSLVSDIDIEELPKYIEKFKNHNKQ